MHISKSFSASIKHGARCCSLLILARISSFRPLQEFLCAVHFSEEIIQVDLAFYIDEKAWIQGVHLGLLSNDNLRY